MEYKKEFPNDVFYRWFVGMAYINKQRWKEGLEIYDEFEENLESINFNGREADVECWYYKALCLYHLGRKEEALMLCKKIDEIKEVVNRKVFFYGDYIEMSSELMSKIDIKNLNGQ
jgi:tetratricopeptide (TPR) repeat protein